MYGPCDFVNSIQAKKDTALFVADREDSAACCGIANIVLRLARWAATLRYEASRNLTATAQPCLALSQHPAASRLMRRSVCCHLQPASLA
jgi:hypothetical protein